MSATMTPRPRSLVLAGTSVLAFALVYLATRRFLDSPYGWAFQSLHQENTVSEAIGIDTSRMRTLAFALTGTIAGFGGAIYAPALGYISPSLFNLDISIQVIMVAIIGGMVVLEGSLIGGAFVIFVPDLLRDLPGYNQVVFGVILVLFVILLPEGITTVANRGLLASAFDRLADRGDTERVDGGE